MASRRFTRFGVGFHDFDNDGRLDLYEANGRVGLQAETEVAGRKAIIPTIAGRAWTFGLHQIALDPSDPLANGFAMTDTWGPQAGEIA